MRTGILLTLLALGGATPALAEVPLSKALSGRSNLSAEYRSLIRAPVPGALEGQLRRPSRLSEGDWSVPRYTGNPGVYQDMARAAARRHQVPEELFLRLVSTESNFHPSARSSKGAIGLAQLMPHTARLLGVNPFDPGQNLDGGARYLSQQYRRFGDWRLALAAYNAGPGAVERYRGVPPYAETQNYVRRILGR
jgi:soluble lytic murein transglycosylase-like protein